MSKRWTEYEPMGSNVVSADGFNAEYNAQKGSLNGGVDRTMLPGGYFTRAHLKDESMHKVSLTTGIELSDSYKTTNGSVDEFDGLEYSFYSGGWRNAANPVAISGMREGMAYVEFNGWYWYNRFTSGFRSFALSSESDHDHWVRFRILYNGTVVFQSSKLYTLFDNFVFTANHPVTGGTAQYQIQFAFSPASQVESPVDDPDTSMMFFGGAQFMSIGRWR